MEKRRKTPQNTRYAIKQKNKTQKRKPAKIPNKPTRRLQNHLERKYTRTNNEAKKTTELLTALQKRQPQNITLQKIH